MVRACQELSTGKGLPAKSPDVEFAIVLSRVIGSVNDDPAQLRDVIYELARIKLQRELAHGHPLTSVSETRHLTLALESAIEHVESVYSNHENLNALRAVDHVPRTSKLNTFGSTVEPREPVLRIIRSQAAISNTDHHTAGFSGKAASSRCWNGAASLLRGAMVAILAVALCMVLDRQFAIFGRQAPRPVFTPVVQKNRETRTEAACPSAWPSDNKYAAVTIPRFPPPERLWRLCG